MKKEEQDSKVEQYFDNREDFMSDSIARFYILMLFISIGIAVNSAVSIVFA